MNYDLRLHKNILLKRHVTYQKQKIEIDMIKFEKSDSIKIKFNQYLNLYMYVIVFILF